MSFDFSSLTSHLQKTMDHIRADVATLRTGRATAQLLDPVRVEAYGTFMKLQEVGSVSVPDANLLVISPWDKSLLLAIEKAIQTANLNLNPVVDGQIIRISVPPLTAETRELMVKQLHQKLEAGRVMLRNLRTDTKRDIEKQKGSEGISEDDIQADLDQLETEIKSSLDQLESLGTAKEQDLRQI